MCPYVCLRLPDVIGPYDSTYRYWAYHRWIRAMPDTPLEVSLNDTPFSLVFSLDVVDVIVQLIHRSDLASIEGEAFNLAFEETCNLETLLNLMCAQAHVKREIVKKKGAKTFLSSVECGPSCIEKAKKRLQFQPTPLPKALEATDAFFNDAQRYRKESMALEHKIKKKLKQE